MPEAVGRPMARGDWLRVLAGALAVAAAYAPLFPAMAAEWMTFPNLSHGFAIPLIASYLVWSRRAELAGSPAGSSWIGLGMLGAALALYAVGIRGGEPFVGRISLPLALLGTVVFLAGPTVAARLRLGILYLAFMIPLPWATLKSLTDSLRVFDAAMTAAMLPWVGVPVFQEGVLLHLPDVTLEVADVCSSVPAIASLLALGAAYAYARPRTRAARLTLLAAAAPLAVASNMVRITLTAAGAHYLGPIALDNVVHAWNGATVFMMTLGALVLLDRSFPHRQPGRR